MSLPREHETEHESEEGQFRYRPDFITALTDSLGEGVYAHDREGHVTFMNPAAEHMLGWKFSELRGQHVHEAIHFQRADGTRTPAAECPLLGVMESKTTLSGDDMFTRKDGSLFHISYTSSPIITGGEVTGAVLAFRDITGRKRAEQAILESEERYRAVAETASDAIITIDAESMILFINPAAERIFGHTVAEMAGQSLTMLMPDYLRHLHREGLARYVETGSKHISWNGVELPGLHKDGHEIPLEVSFSETVKDGKHYFTGIARDITERKRAEAEREQLLARERQAREQAEEANRIKDEFLATLSHELRTPMTSILGWTQLIRGGQVNQDAFPNALEIIYRNAHAQTQLIDDLLDVSRVMTGKLRLDVRSVELSSVIVAATDAVRPAAEGKGIRLQTLLDPKAGPVSGDPDRLQQVIWNLMSNAVKFTPKGGRVQVRLERINSHVEITVSDTGCGIAPEFLPHVFDRFRQADQSHTRIHGGLGLGLAIVRQLIELHGGTVHAHSLGEGQGAAFTVSLPLLPIRAETTREGEERVHPAAETGAPLDCPPQLDGLHVVVVDDEPDTRDLLVAVLTGCGARVRAAGSSAEALALIEEEKPDVLVSDIGMPGENGYELITKVRQLLARRGDKVPAVALTAYARVEDRVRALSAGYQVHIPKPVEPVELITAVASLAGRIGRGSGPLGQS